MTNSKLICFLFALLLFQTGATKHTLKQITLSSDQLPEKAPSVSFIQTQDDTGTYPRLSEYNGQSYDIFNGNPLANRVDKGFTGRRIFNFTYDVDRKTTDGYFYIPNELDVADDLSCSFSSSSVQHTGLKSYQSELSAAATVTGSYNGYVSKASFTGSTEYSEMSSTLAEDSKVAVVTKASCKLYTGTIRPSATTLTEDFKEAVKTAYESGDWETFIDDWGTHYATTIEYGAAAIQKSVFTRKDVQKLTACDVDVAAAVSAKFASVRGSASASVSLSDSQSTAFSKATSKTSASYVGLQPPSSFDIDEWLASIADSQPVPLKFELAPISDVFDDYYFGTTYTAANLADMVTAFDTAVIQVALTMDRVPDLDAFLDDAAVSTVKTLYGNTAASTSFEHGESTNVLTTPSKITYCVRTHDSLVSGIGITVTDGETENEKTASGPCKDGTWSSWSLPENHTIAFVDIWYNNSYITGLYFHTDRGAVSPLIGDDSGTMKRHILDTDSEELTGFYGSYDDYALTSLGLMVLTIDFSYTPSIVASKTSTYGGSSDDSTSFSDPKLPSTTIELSEIRFWIVNKEYISAIQVVVLDDGETLENSVWGDSSVGTEVVFTSSGNTISSIQIWYDCVVKGVQFTYSDSTTSDLYGSKGGFSETIEIDGGEITGVLGTYSFSAIESIGFIYNSYS